MEPSALYLILNSHLQLIGFLFGGRGVKVQVWLFMSAANSVSMACFQEGCWMASWKVLGSEEDVTAREKCLWEGDR